MSKQKQTRHYSKAKLSGLIASGVCAFIGYGYINGLNAASPHPASQTEVPSYPAPPLVDGKKRDVILNDAKDAKKTEGPKTVLLNDPFMQTHWGLAKTNAVKAWEVTQGSKDIIVAVIDTGIDVAHKDLAENLWINPGENGLDKNGHDKSNNGIDDDANGFIDDIHGWNFAGSNANLVDNHGHGTHIAGIIGGRGPTISGVAPHVSLMVLKYYDPKAAAANNLKSTVEAIKYAVKMHANIINYSGGGTDYSAEEHDAVKEAEKAGILFVAAAGNEKSNSDEAGKHYYPADYGLSNIISVTAVNKEDTKVLPSSNYGVRTVDIAAPGENIYSTLPGNGFGMMTGTSQATAFVTGVASLIMAHNRDFNYSDVKKYILKTGDEYATLLSKTGSAKLLNSYKALTSLDKGVSASGVVATNMARVPEKAFSLDQNIKDPKFDDTAAINGQAPTEAIAMFGKEFLKALNHKNVDGSDEPEVRAH